MELKGSKTEAIIRQLFNRELQTSARYTYLASVLKENGFDKIADIFAATAKNEAEHADHEFRFLENAGDVRVNLQSAVTGEHEKATQIYPEATCIAQVEGFSEIADFFQRMSATEAKHEERFRELLQALDAGTEIKGRTVDYSATEMAEVMQPFQANPMGRVHGGELMKMMDTAASVVGARHCRMPVVTGSVERITFRQPVNVGELVTVRGKMIFVSRSTMEVALEVYTTSIRAEKTTHALTAYFIVVALGTDGKPAEVPPLLLSTEEEERLYAEGQARYLERKASSWK